MGEKETLTLPVQQLPTPPIGDLPFNIHHLAEDDNTNIHPNQSEVVYQSPRMAHEAYLTSQYGAGHYPESHHGVGLGIQYVSCSFAKYLQSRQLTCKA
jgi:hypothetical protein